MTFNFRTVLASSVAVIRSYNNKHVFRATKLYLKMGFGRVIVVVRNNVDQGSTRGWLKRIQDPRLQIIEMGDGYNWVPALNAAAQSVINANLFGAQFSYVFNVSVEAQFKTEEVQALFEEICSSEQVGVVGTSFQGVLDGNKVSTGRSYRHPRNTGMLCRVDALTSGHLFQAYCDNVGGMEDIDFLLKLLVMGKYSYRHLDLQVRLILGEHHNQEKKEKREQAAMDQIMKHWRSICPNGGTEIARIEQAISQMGLEEE